MIEIYCRGYTSRWRKQGSLNILASVNQEERRREERRGEEKELVLFDFTNAAVENGSLRKNGRLFVYARVCVCLLCVLVGSRWCACTVFGVTVQPSRYRSKTGQMLTPILCRGSMEETEEMELRAFKLTVNFRKTTRCERKGHCYWKTKTAD